MSPDIVATSDCSIDVTTLAGLRDRALDGHDGLQFARVSAVVAMCVEDYYATGKRWWVSRSSRDFS